PLEQAAERPGIARLWARKRIGALEAARLSPSIIAAVSEAIVDAKILTTALDYQITSRLTSLIAIDDQVTRPATEELAKSEVALNLPEGWNPAVFLPIIAPADEIPPLDEETEARLYRINAEVPAAEDASEGADAPVIAAAPSAPQHGAYVPRGSADWQLTLWLGLLAALAGALLLMHARRRPV
ncbi:MAG: hypothetical protein AAGJ28_14625, partial [Pseudomonadota bacterium]